MRTEDYDAELAVVRSTSAPIYDIGTAIYLSQDVFDLAIEWGWSNPIAFYFTGRGGMLGDVGAGVVCSAFGWFEPKVVRMFFEEGLAVMGAQMAAQQMAAAHAMWGRQHMADVKDLRDIVALIETLVARLQGSALPLFVGWRSAPRAEDDAGRAAQLIQILREWRGGLHLVATTAVGLTPMEAILTNEGEGQAKFFGWPEPFPNCGAIRYKHDEAEAMTDRLAAASLAQALGPERFEELEKFKNGIHALRSALP